MRSTTDVRKRFDTLDTFATTQRMTWLNTYLNRFNDQTNKTETFYGDALPDYRVIVTKAKECFATATSAIEKELNFDTSIDAGGDTLDAINVRAYKA